jgi:adenine-specific DNA-methyltransferase
MYPITGPDGQVHHPPPSTSWRFNETKFKDMIADNRIWFGVNGTARPMQKKFLTEVKDGITVQTWWDRDFAGDNKIAKYESKLIFPMPFSTPKPEKLLQQILHIGSGENDIVLDFFMGSATTPSVAHKMRRKYIGVEQMDYIDNVSVERLKKVIAGEQGGISKDVNWQGGGSFVYAELMQYNQKYIDAIQNAENKEQLITVWNDMQDTAFLSYQFDKKTFNERLDAFKTALIEEMKQYLVEVLDKNQLYVNYSEINDDTFQVSPADIILNKQFYAKK